jgi:hypothetical protein
MGKLKQALIAFDEQRTAKNLLTKDPRNNGLSDDDMAWAQYEAEFNEWLDKYEASFGDEKGYLP